jgi:hypothetical protein
MTRLITTLAVVTFCPLWLFAGSAPSISGKVTDSEGAVIAKVRVLIHWDSSGSAVGLTDNLGTKQDVIVVTDASGQYSANLPPGFYDVFVSATAFTPIATKVRVKEGKPSIFSPKLNVDPLVSKELAHEIYPSK